MKKKAQKSTQKKVNGITKTTQKSCEKSDEQRYKKKDYAKNRYQNMSGEDKQNLKEYQKEYRKNQYQHISEDDKKKRIHEKIQKTQSKNMLKYIKVNNELKNKPSSSKLIQDFSNDQSSFNDHDDDDYNCEEDFG